MGLGQGDKRKPTIKCFLDVWVGIWMEYESSWLLDMTELDNQMLSPYPEANRSSCLPHLRDCCSCWVCHTRARELFSQGSTCGHLPER